MTVFDIGGMGAKGAAVRRLFGAVQQFLARTNVSPDAAGAIKALLDELYPDDVRLQEAADKLALYRLGGGKKALGEREIRESLKGVESHLRRTLLPRSIEGAANMSLIDLPDVFLEMVKPDLSPDDDVNWYFAEIVKVLYWNYGCTIEVAERLASEYYAKFSNRDYCHSIGIPVQDDDYFFHEGAGGIAMRIYYCLVLKLEPDHGSFVEWRQHHY